MKGFLFSCLFFTSMVHAEAIQIKVTNFNFTYNDPYGEGSASSFSRKSLNEGVSVKVEKVENDFLLSATGSENQEFVFKDAPSFMTEAETMDVKNFNLDFSQALALSLGSGRFRSSDDSLKLDDFKLSCTRDLTLAQEMDQVINGCMKKMSFKASHFSSESLKSGLESVLSEALSMSLMEKGDLKINDLDLQTKNDKYQLEAEVKAQISGKVKSDGNMSYDAAKGLVTLKISEVKFGFFNITGKVFDELEKNESEKLRVKKPYVYYSIK